MFEPRILSKDDLRTLWRDVQVSHTGPFGCFYSRDLIATIDDLTTKLKLADDVARIARVAVRDGGMMTDGNFGVDPDDIKVLKRTLREWEAKRDA